MEVANNKIDSSASENKVEILDSPENSGSQQSQNQNAVNPETKSNSSAASEIVEISKDEYEQLLNELKETKQKNAELSDKYLRTLADTENFKKRQQEQIAGLRKFALENFLIELLPIIDNFQRAFNERQNADSLEKSLKIIDGLKLIQNQLENILTKNNVEKIESLNQRFNPELHNAIQSEPVDDDKLDNIVLEEYQRGYRLHNRTIRAAMVKVGKKK